MIDPGMRETVQMWASILLEVVLPFVVYMGLMAALSVRDLLKGRRLLSALRWMLPLTIALMSYGAWSWDIGVSLGELLVGIVWVSVGGTVLVALLDGVTRVAQERLVAQQQPRGEGDPVVDEQVAGDTGASAAVEHGSTSGLV